MERLAFAASGFVIVAAAHATGFDCSKASTAVERMICANPQISKLDDELNAKYKAALADPDMKNIAQKRQRFWLKQRNDCNNEGCIRIRYENRIDELTPREKGIQDIRSRLEIPAYSETEDSEFCKRLLQGLSSWNGVTDLAPIASADSVHHKVFRHYFGKCNPSKFIKMIVYEPRIWESLELDSVPETEREQYGQHYVMQKGFRLYRANMENTPDGKEQLLLYGAGVIHERAEPDDTSANLSELNMIDPESCSISASAQVEDVVNEIPSFIGILQFGKLNLVYSAKHYPRESLWALDVQKLNGSFAMACHFVAKDKPTKVQ
jgi:uncharacterized protein YecT (DUF1311 family)